MLKAVVPLMISMAMLSGGAFLVLERPAWLPVYGETGRVLVFVVGDRERVDLVRRAVDPGRIVGDSPDAIALAEGRIVAANADAVGAIYQQAGWMERKIELFDVQRADHLARARKQAGGGGEADEERLQKLRALVDKPTLSAGEQMFVLQAMNDGLEF